MNIAKNLTALREEIPANVTLVLVTKTRTTGEIMEAYQAGHRHFGENKVQELIEKAEKLPKDIAWHMVGHLQSNKVKYIAPFIHLIHGVDSLKLLKVIDKEGRKNEKLLSCLLQVHIAEEETKFGFDRTELFETLQSDDFKELTNCRIMGLMGMATFTDDRLKIRNEFRSLHKLYNEVRERFFPGADYFSELSMGMSDDYQIALEEGATIVRIGSKIFGPRDSCKAD